LKQYLQFFLKETVKMGWVKMYCEE